MPAVLKETVMYLRKASVVGLKILGVCLLYAACVVVGSKLSGLVRIAQQSLPAQSSTSSRVFRAIPVASQTASSTQPAIGSVLFGFLTFSICVGIAVSYLILRSSWRGWTLVGALAVGMYGISTVVTQIESVFFLPGKFPRGMIGAIFIQGAIVTVLFAPLAVLLLGKWRAAPSASSPPAPARIIAASAAWRLPFLVFAFVILYLFFGYYVAWQNPDLRQYYGGPDWPTFFDALKGNWLMARWIYPVASVRALLYIGFMYPLIRMLRVPRWESAAASALFLSAWTTVLLLPSPFMPASVARSHFWETLEFSLIYGSLLGWLLSTPPAANKSDR